MLRSVRAMTGLWDDTRPVTGAFAAFLEFQDGAAATSVYNGYDRFHSNDLVFDVGEPYQPPDIAFLRPRPQVPAPTAALTPRSRPSAPTATVAATPPHPPVRPPQPPPVGPPAPTSSAVPR